MNNAIKNIISNAMQQRKMSANGIYNYGPIEYLKQNINSTADPLEFEKYIHLVTDINTYAVYCRLSYDVYIDRTRLFYDVRRAFPSMPDCVIAGVVNNI